MALIFGDLKLPCFQRCTPRLPLMEYKRSTTRSRPLIVRGLTTSGLLGMSLIPRPPLESDIIGLPSAYWKILRVRRALEVSPDDHSSKHSSERFSTSSINETIGMRISEDPFSARFDSRTPSLRQWTPTKSGTSWSRT